MSECKHKFTTDIDLKITCRECLKRFTEQEYNHYRDEYIQQLESKVSELEEDALRVEDGITYTLLNHGVEVEQLEDKIKQLEGDKWVSVDERLPKQGDCVLCIVDGYECDETNGYGVATFDGFFYYQDSEDGMYEQVTHWQEIKPPVKE